MKMIPKISDAPKKIISEQTGFLMGSVLVATPELKGSVFEKTVIYITAHGAEGAMGFVLNRPMAEMRFEQILAQVGLALAVKEPMSQPVLWGGPVDPVRGFVVHSLEVETKDTIVLQEGIGLSATLDIMRLFHEGMKPIQSFFALGYAGWSAGQLEQELSENSWLVVEASADLIFGQDYKTKWQRALGVLGIDPAYLSTYQGLA